MFWKVLLRYVCAAQRYYVPQWAQGNFIVIFRFIERGMALGVAGFWFDGSKPCVCLGVCQIGAAHFIMSVSCCYRRRVLFVKGLLVSAPSIHAMWCYCRVSHFAYFFSPIYCNGTCPFGAKWSSLSHFLSHLSLSGCNVTKQPTLWPITVWKLKVVMDWIQISSTSPIRLYYYYRAVCS